ncbi:MAG: hypothetical protein GSR86_04310 [Desulfurococcales archaeon]|nr:hypothetical protein [Desulfurococcales archaeon]
MPPRLRRGQAEVLGGLIVLTLIFLLAVPLLLSYIQQAREVSELAAENKMKTLGP